MGFMEFMVYNLIIINKLKSSYLSDLKRLNFIIIAQLTNKVFIVFYQKKSF